MSYLKSKNVKVYPSAYRGAVDGQTLFNPESRIPSEFNISTAVNSIINRGISNQSIDHDHSQGSFVISYINNILACSIHGYIFRLTIPSNTKFNNFNDLFAYIKLEAKNTGYDDTDNEDYPALSLSSYEEDDALDTATSVSDSEFTGLSIEGTSRTCQANEYKLHILTWSSTKYIIPALSGFKFNSKEISDVDDNEVEDGTSIHERFTTDALKVTDNADILNLHIGETLFDYQDREAVLPYYYEDDNSGSCTVLNDYGENLSLCLTEGGMSYFSGLPEDRDWEENAIFEANSNFFYTGVPFEVRANDDATDDTDHLGSLHTEGGATVKKKLRVWQKATFKDDVDIAGDTLITGTATVKDGLDIYNSATRTAYVTKTGLAHFQSLNISHESVFYDNISIMNGQNTKILLDQTTGDVSTHGFTSSTVVTDMGDTPTIHGIATKAIYDDINKKPSKYYLHNISLKENTTDTIQSHLGSGGLLDEVKISKVDAAGDADKLNNKNPSYYLDYNNFTNTPTIGNGTLTLFARSSERGGGNQIVFSANTTQSSLATLTLLKYPLISSTITSEGTYQMSDFAKNYSFLLFILEWKHPNLDVWMEEPLLIPTSSTSQYTNSKFFGVYKRGWTGGVDWSFYFHIINDGFIEVTEIGYMRCTQIYGIGLEGFQETI